MLALKMSGPIFSKPGCFRLTGGWLITHKHLETIKHSRSGRLVSPVVNGHVPMQELVVLMQLGHFMVLLLAPLVDRLVAVAQGVLHSVQHHPLKHPLESMTASSTPAPMIHGQQPTTEYIKVPIACTAVGVHPVQTLRKELRRP